MKEKQKQTKPEQNKTKANKQTTKKKAQKTPLFFSAAKWNNLSYTTYNNEVFCIVFSKLSTNSDKAVLEKSKTKLFFTPYPDMLISLTSD